MLISQRIAASPYFLKEQGEFRTYDSDNFLSELRRDVIEAEKFLIDDYGMSEPDETSQPKTTRELEKEIFGGFTKTARTKREQQYVQYARPPFPKMVLESNHRLFYISEAPPGHGPGWCLFAVTADGFVSPIQALSYYESNEEDRQRVRLVSYNPEYNRFMDFVADELEANPDNEELLQQQRAFEDVLSTVRLFQWVAAETLMLINCRNVRRVPYTPNQREMKGIPGAIQKQLKYTILDVFRERVEYTSLKDVSAHLWEPREGKKTRAHMVRGHFKNKKTGLFWWNHFMRNRKNRDESGEVKKTYVVYIDN